MENLEKNLKAAGGEYYAGNKVGLDDLVGDGIVMSLFVSRCVDFRLQRSNYSSE